jgi:hypothetical protein
MNANPDQPVDDRLQAASSTLRKLEKSKASSVDPPATRKTWYHSYDEEWADFLAKSSMKKARPGINHEEPEPLPRVWNAPHA